tara:strand:+ start:134 stop:949 length:816 start_codon:yes stop_codon:yes gene_type:complete
MINNFVSKCVKKFHNSIFGSNFASIFLENCIASLRGKKHKFYYNKKDKIFIVSENSIKRKFINKVRGFAFYRNGIKSRGKFLITSYCLQNINFDENDVIIDCGANFGDLFIGLEDNITPTNYIAIEPNPSDFEVLKQNSPKSILVNKALGNLNGTMPFYVSTEDGDSSLVKPIKFEKVIDIPVVRLDKLTKELNLDKIKLLKIEGEGYEPEILEGAGKMLNKCEYIAVDGGYERGPSCEQTFTTITNYLLNNGFEMKDIYFPWYRALFIRK